MYINSNHTAQQQFISDVATIKNLKEIMGIDGLGLLLRNQELPRGLRSYEDEVSNGKLALQRIELLKGKMLFSLEMLCDSLEDLTSNGTETCLNELDIIGRGYEDQQVIYCEFDIQWLDFRYYANDKDQNGSTVHVSDASAFELAQIIKNLIDLEQYAHHFSNNLFDLYGSGVNELKQTDTIITIFESAKKGIHSFRASANGNNFETSVLPTKEACLTFVLKTLFPKLNLVLFPNGETCISYIDNTTKKLRELGYYVNHTYNYKESLDIIAIRYK